MQHVHRHAHTLLARIIRARVGSQNLVR